MTMPSHLVIALVLALAPAAARAGGDLRDLLIRYAADLGSLERTYRIPTAEADRDRFARFYETAEAELAAARLRRPRPRRPGRRPAAEGRAGLPAPPARPRGRPRRGDRRADPLPRDDRRPRSVPPPRRARRPEGDRRPARRPGRRVAALADAIEEQEKKDASEVTPTEALYASRRLDELRRALRRWYEFYEGYDPRITWWAKAPHGRAAEELERYAKLVRERLAGVDDEDEDAIVGEPIGREALLVELQHEMIPYTPERVDRHRREGVRLV